jgi:hypothetical protein
MRRGMRGVGVGVGMGREWDGLECLNLIIYRTEKKERLVLG